jgi:MFS family permease
MLPSIFTVWINLPTPLCCLCAGLALVIPSGQSLVADYYPAASRGSAFGALYLTSALGGMGGSFFATNLGERSNAPPDH